MLEVQQAIARRVELQEVIRLITQEARRLTVSAGALLFLREESGWSLAGAIGHSTHSFADHRIAAAGHTGYPGCTGKNRPTISSAHGQPVRPVWAADGDVWD